MTAALQRLQQQIDDLIVRYSDAELDDRPLMQQLVEDGPHLKPNLGVARRLQPSSKPPCNLTAYQLHTRIIRESADWAWTLGGANIHINVCLSLIPELVGQRLDTGDTQKMGLLHGPTGVYAAAGNWHITTRILLGYERPADRYPDAICPHCQTRGSLRGRELSAWCSNPHCRDDHGHRHELNPAELYAAGVDLTLTCAT